MSVVILSGPTYHSVLRIRKAVLWLRFAAETLMVMNLEGSQDSLAPEASANPTRHSHHHADPAFLLAPAEVFVATGSMPGMTMTQQSQVCLTTGCFWSLGKTSCSIDLL
jgi:hypothetical protein